ncbi:AraC family transcriptional regulator [Superficieibacter sp. HKU1]|uniref:AraC family transcriptional regulator n=1 Tax=Superficieibacter sp. HKU1 TaxID=3031919 RepID=UPI0023E1EA1D|nr:AraC family transcriptional regulator [Superficieibacter sp. HKU1]WES67740.1 AraC family transcriptional regulator [Superficieibacter sp. HKU1]
MNEMVSLLNRLAPHEGYTCSQLDNVRFMRSNRSLARTLVVYEPCIVIVCQGHKRGYLANRVYHYDPQHYLVLSVPLPFATETEASADEPLLAVAVTLDLRVLSELALALDRPATSVDAAPEGIISTPLNGQLADTALRLLRALACPEEASILGPQIVRELYYRVLIGDRGNAIRAALAHHGQFASIARSLQRIHGDCAQPLSVTTLAGDAGLSIPAFHKHFKQVTGTSPLQYIKSIRLNQARLLMIRDNLTAAAAAFRVGYESPSQFNREFRRQFGRSPGEEAKEMKAAFALFPPV